MGLQPPAPSPPGSALPVIGNIDEKYLKFEKNSNKRHCTYITKYILGLDTFVQSQVEQADNCPYDYVELVDGSTDAIKRLCGSFLTSAQRTVRSKSSSLLVHMHTDSAKQHRGFSALYKGTYD